MFRRLIAKFLAWWAMATAKPVETYEPDPIDPYLLDLLEQANINYEATEDQP